MSVLQPLHIPKYLDLIYGVCCNTTINISCLPCRVIVHVLNGDSTDPIGDFHAINQELELFNPRLANKTQVVVVNKIDIPEVREKLPSLIQELRKISGHTRILGISAATRENTKELINRVNKLVNSLPAQSSYELFMEEEKRVNFLEMDTVDTSTGDGSGRDFEIIPMNENESEDGITQRVGVENSGLVKHKAFKVVGKKIEKLVKMTNWDYYEAVTRFQRILDAQGITAALEEAGAKQGDMIVIGDWQFQYWDKKNRWVADLGIEEIISPRERYVSDADNDENENNL